MGKAAVFKTQQGKNDVINHYDIFLQKWASSYEKFYVNTRYGNTFIIADGAKSNPPLILLHGSGMNSVMWLRDIGSIQKLTGYMRWIYRENLGKVMRTILPGNSMGSGTLPENVIVPDPMENQEVCRLQSLQQQLP